MVILGITTFLRLPNLTNIPMKSLLINFVLPEIVNVLPRGKVVCKIFFRGVPLITKGDLRTIKQDICQSIRKAFF